MASHCWLEVRSLKEQRSAIAYTIQLPSWPNQGAISRSVGKHALDRTYLSSYGQQSHVADSTHVVLRGINQISKHDVGQCMQHARYASVSVPVMMHRTFHSLLHQIDTSSARYLTGKSHDAVGKGGNSTG